MKKKKLLFTIGTFFPAQAGGPDNSVYWLNKAIFDYCKNYSCLVLSFFYQLNSKDIVKYKIRPNVISNINGVEVIFFNYFFFRLFSFGFWKFIILNLKKFNFVHMNSFFFPVTLFCTIFLRLFNIKHCISLRGELENQAFKNNFLKKKIFLFLYKLFYKKVSFFHCTTIQEKSKTKLILKNKNKFEIFPNYISKNILKMYQPKKKNGYLYLGRLHPKKNIEKIILAFNKFQLKKKNNSKLYIVGTGEKSYANKLKKIASNLYSAKNIIFTGKKNFTEKFQYLNQCKFLIFFSKTENFGNVILESLACKTPVIVSKNLPWHIIGKLKSGYLIKNNIKELSDCLIFADKLSKTKYKKLQKQTFTVFKKFIIDYNIKKIIKIYEKYI